MKTFLTALLLVAIQNCAHGQDQSEIEKQTFSIPLGTDGIGVKYLLFASDSADCSMGRKFAEEDISKKYLCLIVASGFAPITYASDKSFEEKFRIHYYEEGCSSPSVDCMTAYNRRIFEYLTEAFGKEWMKSIRKDVVGLKGWKAKYLK
jgi:hypothetical protein